MRNNENIFKSELIPLLIKYKETLGIVSPIKRLKYFILNNKKYEFNINKFNDTREKNIIF